MATSRNSNPWYTNGKIWMRGWLTVFVIHVLWGIGTVLWWYNSTRNLNYLSVDAILLACGAGVQATFSMRKADQDDDF